MGQPYRYYLLDNGVLTGNVRLPGLMLAYAPAAAAGVDLRIATLLFEAGALLLLWWLIEDRRIDGEPSSQALWPVGFFLLFPYWHYRHDLYEAHFWRLLLGTLIALEKGRWVAVALGTGLLVCTHQWGFLFAPYIVLAVFRRRGWRAAAALAAGAGLVALAGLGLVVRTATHDFLDHVFGLYNRMVERGDFYPMSMYFSPVFARLHAAFLLRPIHWLLQLPLLALAFRYGLRTDKPAAILALSLMAVLLFNPVCWTYQYLLVLFLLLVALVLCCARAGEIGSTGPREPQIHRK